MASTKKSSDLEAHLRTRLIQIGAPTPVSEFIFHPTRKWRFDLSYPQIKLAIEIEGGTWGRNRRSRHTTGVGFHNDCIKYNTAAMMGWVVLRFTSDMILDDSCLEVIQEAIKLRTFASLPREIIL